jgi:hypothetical protein
MKKSNHKYATKYAAKSLANRFNFSPPRKRKEFTVLYVHLGVLPPSLTLYPFTPPPLLDRSARGL